MISERIKKLRKALDLTQQEFAAKIGVKRNTVATYEMGRSTPSDSALTLISKTFNVSEEWLRNGTGEMYLPKPTAALELLAIENNLTNADYLLIEKFLNLKPEIKQSFIDYIREVATAIQNSENDGISANLSVAFPSEQTGVPVTNDEIKRRTAKYMEQAQDGAYTILQQSGIDPEIETEVELYRQQRIQEKKREQQASSANGQDVV